MKLLLVILGFILFGLSLGYFFGGTSISESNQMNHFECIDYAEELQVEILKDSV